MLSYFTPTISPVTLAALYQRTTQLMDAAQIRLAITNKTIRRKHPTVAGKLRVGGKSTQPQRHFRLLACIYICFNAAPTYAAPGNIEISVEHLAEMFQLQLNIWAGDIENRDLIQLPAEVTVSAADTSPSTAPTASTAPDSSTSSSTAPHASATPEEPPPQQSQAPNEQPPAAETPLNAAPVESKEQPPSEKAGEQAPAEEAPSPPAEANTNQPPAPSPQTTQAPKEQPPTTETTRETPAQTTKEQSPPAETPLNAAPVESKEQPPSEQAAEQAPAKEAPPPVADANNNQPPEASPQTSTQASKEQPPATQTTPETPEKAPKERPPTAKTPAEAAPIEPKEQLPSEKATEPAPAEKAPPPAAEASDNQPPESSPQTSTQAPKEQPPNPNQEPVPTPKEQTPGKTAPIESEKTTEQPEQASSDAPKEPSQPTPQATTSQTPPPETQKSAPDPTLAVLPDPTLELTATPNPLPAGKQVTLRWHSEHAENCTASGAWQGETSLAGSTAFGPFKKDQHFMLSCSNGSVGAVAEIHLVVHESKAVEVKLNTSDQRIGKNNQIRLQWQSKNAQECYASGDWSGDQALNGTFTTPALDNASTFKLTCFNYDREAMAMVSVEVEDHYLRWQAPTTNSDGSHLRDFSSYNIYWGRGSRKYDQVQNLPPEAQSWWAKLLPGHYFAALTTINHEGVESDYSQEVKIHVK